jgi:lipoate-protein ligase A
LEGELRIEKCKLKNANCETALHFSVFIFQFSFFNFCMPFVRELPCAIADGPHNMAADEVLLQSAIRGVASLRFYGWTIPTISLGYFQPERRRRDDPLLASLPFVRRASGGDALVHHFELTYALALPAGVPWQTGEPWSRRMHAVIASAFWDFGIVAQLHAQPADRPFTGTLCFAHLTASDLRIGSTKVVGSAQRRQRGAFLQHGVILLACSPHAPMLPGVRELTGRCLTVEETCDSVRRAFTTHTGWAVAPGAWTEAEQRLIEELAATKYGQDWWNCKR